MEREVLKRSMNSIEIPCRYLSWDSEFFGNKIAQVVGQHLSPEQVVRIQMWCEQNEIECLFLLAGSDHDETIMLAEKNGFHLVDVRMTFVLRNLTASNRSMSGASSGSGIRLRAVQSADIARLETIARTAHQDSRFYYDHHFPSSRCSDLYATWIRRSCEDFADQVLIAEIHGDAVGYITCSRLSEEMYKGAIGLLGVDSAARGNGVGPALVNCAVEWFVGEGIQEVQVVTQGRNIPAQRMYQRCGFLTHSVQHWYHRWS
jgi:dTDP-4-amino-4,6-dideoxy-D-galactose acyltransferase